MRKAVPVVAVIAIVLALLVAGVVMGLSANQSENSPTPTPAASPSPSPTATPTTISPTPIPIAVPYDFTISDISSLSITQGQYITRPIKLTTISGNASSVNPQDVIWSTDSGSSGIQFDFRTSYAYENEYFASYFPDLFTPNGFNCVLTITVPSSTPTDNYNINITAKIGSNSHSISMLVSVPSAEVTVSGTVDTSILGVTPSQIAFRDQADPNGIYYKVTLTGNTYSISVPNNRAYLVMISDSSGYVRNIEWYNWISDSCTVKVPAGSSSMTQDFNVPAKSTNPIITVSGTIIDGNSGIRWSQLQFQNKAAPAKVYYAAITENGTYSIDLPNNSVYDVCIDNGTAPNHIFQWHVVDILFTVKVPADSTTMTKDFTVPQPVTFFDPSKIIH